MIDCSWNGVKSRHPKFAAMVDILRNSRTWREECPDETSWHFKTHDGRFWAEVHWPTHTVDIYFTARQWT
jgi:hypothetical protein